jgi:hypothetical protein
MNDENGIHTPTPEFRASLEEEVVRELYRDLQLMSSGPTSRVSRLKSHMPRLRLIAALVIGMILGVGTGFASAQVQDARQRGELTSAMTAQRQLAAVKLELAQANYDLVRRRVELGVLSPSALREAEAGLQATRTEVEKLEIDLQEIRVTAVAPRDELWAPLVGTRDFVKERLGIGAATAQKHLATAQAELAEQDRRFRAGVVTQTELNASRSAAQDAQRAADLAAQKLMLRRQFRDEHLSPDEIGRRLQRFELMNDVARAQQEMDSAELRLKLARSRRDIGAVGDLEVKKAEVDALERKLELERVKVLLMFLEKRGKQ